MNTKQVIAAMLTENTGRHILDSGGAYGRHWERNSGMTVDMWDATASASIDRWGCIDISTYHYLVDRLEYAPELDAMFQEFAGTSTEPHWADIQNWLESLGLTFTSWNTYNGEDFLSQVIQGATFEYADEWYVILHTHNGADVRGGYSTPHIFLVTCDMAEHFPYDNSDAEIWCNECDWGYTVRAGGSELIDRDGSYVSGKELSFDSLFPTVDDIQVDSPQCPKCSSAVTVTGPYPCQ